MISSDSSRIVFVSLGNTAAQFGKTRVSGSIQDYPADTPKNRISITRGMIAVKAETKAQSKPVPTFSAQTIEHISAKYDIFFCLFSFLHLNSSSFMLSYLSELPKPLPQNDINLPYGQR